MATFFEIAKAAFVYGYPAVDLYNILYKYAADTNSPEFKAPLNHIYNTRRLATPEDKTIVAMNVDTPYSYAWLDLRAEPVVLSIPYFEPHRYVSLMLCDLYTYIIGYVSPRTNGTEGGDFLVAGPDWVGNPPPGIKHVFRAPTQLALGLYRTQLFNEADLPNVWRIQDQFSIQRLSSYVSSPPPRPASSLHWRQPVDVRKDPSPLDFFGVLNWMLQYMPVLDDERVLRTEVELIGVKPSQDFAQPDATMKAELEHGMKAGLQEMETYLRTVKSSGELFGSREFLGHNYLSRATGAMIGILGNAKEEFLGIGYQADAEGNPFDGTHKYEIKFTPDTMPPVSAFWSITLYDASMYLYANPLNRYVINSPMADRLIKDADGGFTLYIQHESPGSDKEANWLPTPEGIFNLTFRAYQPDKAILDFRYHAPPVVKVA